MNFFNIKKTLQKARNGLLMSKKEGLPGLETPAFLTTTRRAVVPHITPDMTDKLAGIYHFFLSQLYALRCCCISELFYAGELKRLNPTLIGRWMVGDLSEPSPPPPQPIPQIKGNFQVSFNTIAGIRSITAAKYVEAMSLLKPDILVALTDNITEKEHSKKRVHNSVQRSLTFLDLTLSELSSRTDWKPLILAPVQGSTFEPERTLSASQTSQRNVDGFVINAFDWCNHRESALFEPRLNAHLLDLSLDELPVEKLRCAYGLGHPLDVIGAIEAGIDLFDGSFPLLASENGMALNLKFRNEAEFDMLRLGEECYREDFTPMVTGCACASCCLPYTKSYIYHLLEVKEMLASVLLQCHNLYQYSRFFEEIRDSIKEGKWEEEAKIFKTNKS